MQFWRLVLVNERNCRDCLPGVSLAGRIRYTTRYHDEYFGCTSTPSQGVTLCLHDPVVNPFPITHRP